MFKLKKPVALAIVVLTTIASAGVVAAAEPNGSDGPRARAVSLADSQSGLTPAADTAPPRHAKRSAPLSVPSGARAHLRARLDAILAQAKEQAPESPSAFAHVDTYSNRFSWSGAVGSMYFGGEPVTPDIPWDGQSEGKVMTATAIWRLIEQGRIKPTDTLGKFLEPELVNQIDVLNGTNYGPQVTIHELLTHTSGIVDWYDNYPRSFEALYGPDPAQCAAPGDTPARTCAEYRWDPRDLLALAYGLDAYFAPGEAWHYSESNYFLLGLILEKVTGESAASAQRQLVLNRADVPHMWFMSFETPRGPLAHGYDEFRPGDENGYDPVDAMSESSNGTWSYTGGGYAAPGTEWDQFFRDLVEGKIVQPDTVRRMTEASPQSVAANSGKNWVGDGAGLFSYELEGDLFYGHDGYWCSTTVYSPRLQLSVSVTFNAINCGRGLDEPAQSPKFQLVRRLIQAVKAAGQA
jgi:D-alanyl-D-alanine carboxypeptidase